MRSFGAFISGFLMRILLYPGIHKLRQPTFQIKKVLTFVVHFPYVHQELKSPQASGLKPAAEDKNHDTIHNKL